VGREAEGDAIDPAHYRHVVGAFPTGVVVVTACDALGPLGLTCQTFVSLSLRPLLVGIAVGASATVWPRLRGAGAYALHILGEEQEELGRRFARRGGADFSGVEWSPGPGGAPRLAGSHAEVDCVPEEVFEVGDHYFLVGRVVGVALGAGRPLVYYRGNYRRLARLELVTGAAGA
jgi:3-hydroxy-9,10-secoandrosta-1,3,5(10)-triene-9,17-dione monooxygenase reductase component